MLKISRSSDQSTHRWLQVLLGLTLGIAAVSTLRIYRQQEAFETALSTASEPDICALCGKGGDPIWYHAPCLVNLSTGEVGELTIYDPHRSLVGEIAKTQQTGTFSLLHCAGLTAARDTCNYTCSVTLPQEQDQMAPAFFCLDCRALLAEVAQKGYVLLDLYDLQDITAYGNGKFGPNDPITREQAATMVARLAEAMGDNLPSKATRFTDKFNTWAVEPVSKCYGAGIMNGYSDTAFGAKDGYTIEQSIVSLLRAYEYGKGAEAPADPIEEENTTPPQPDKPATQNIRTYKMMAGETLVKDGNKVTVKADIMMPSPDTIFTMNADGTVTETIDRSYSTATTYDQVIIKDASGNVVFDSKNA